MENKMKKTLVICCFLTVFFIQNINSQTLGDVYKESNASFTMSMPSGWQTIDANQKYLMIIGPAENGFSPNIGFADEAYIGSLSDYIDNLVSVLKQFYTGLVVINRGNFSTNSGLQGAYVIIQGRMGQISVRQKIYVFPGLKTDEIITIAGSAPSGNERFDSIFDECVKTFRWTK
jgi:hypothetical protein